MLPTWYVHYNRLSTLLLHTKWQHLQNQLAFPNDSMLNSNTSFVATHRHISANSLLSPHTCLLPFPSTYLNYHCQIIAVYSAIKPPMISFFSVKKSYTRWHSSAIIPFTMTSSITITTTTYMMKSRQWWRCPSIKNTDSPKLLNFIIV
jgi:hypothetical protein